MEGDILDFGFCERLGAITLSREILECDKA
jgi:hypothetical protein